MRSAGNIACMGEDECIRVLVGNPKQEIQLLTLSIILFLFKRRDRQEELGICRRIIL
jgi:hypothetical protein